MMNRRPNTSESRSTREDTAADKANSGSSAINGNDVTDLFQRAANRHTFLRRFKVTIADGVVTLTGHADTFYQKQVAQQVFIKTSGIQTIVNNITVAEGNGRP